MACLADAWIPNAASLLRLFVYIRGRSAMALLEFWLTAVSVADARRATLLLACLPCRRRRCQPKHRVSFPPVLLTSSVVFLALYRSGYISHVSRRIEILAARSSLCSVPVIGLSTFR